MTPPIDPVPRVLIRVVKYPQDKRGEVLVVYVDTRTLSDHAEVVYSVTKHEFRVEPHHRRLMLKTKRASVEQQAEVADFLKQMGWEVCIKQSAPRAFDSDPDEVPVSSVEKRRARPTGFFTRARKGT